MCEVTIETFTLTSLLRDPLIQMVMRSDGVLEKDLAELMFRMKAALSGFDAMEPLPATAGLSEAAPAY
jgi:hypothetical protein